MRRRKHCSTSGSKGFRKSHLEVQIDIHEEDVIVDESRENLPSPEVKNDESKGQNESSGVKIDESRRRHRSCSCQNPTQCMVIESSLFNRGILDRVGHMRVVCNSSPLNSKFKLYCRSLGIREDDNDIDSTQVLLTISLSHFNPLYLKDTWNRKTNKQRIEFVVDNESGRKYDFTLPMNATQVFVTPNYSYDENFRDIAEFDRNCEEAEVIEERNNVKHLKKMEKDEELRISIALLQNDKFNAWLKSNNFFIKKVESEMKLLRLKFVNVTQDLSEALDLLQMGFSRQNIIDPEWYLMHPQAWQYFVGFGPSQAEGFLIIDAIFPDTTKTGGGESCSDSLTELEGCILTRMRMRKRIGLDHLVLMFGRTRQRMGQIVDKWAARWGAAGFDLSDLNMTKEFLQLSIP